MKIASIAPTTALDGELVEFGPAVGDGEMRPSIPSTFQRTVTYQESGLMLTLDCYFAGERVEVLRLSVGGSFERPLSTRDLTQLGLPDVIHEITKTVVPDWDYWTLEGQDRRGQGKLRSDSAFLAQIYWLEHVSHGSPRQALMIYLSMPRSSCSVLIRTLKREFELPGNAN